PRKEGRQVRPLPGRQSSPMKADLLSVEDALLRVLETAEPLPAETVPLLDAAGRVLTADLAALRTQPPDDLSAMDGYAVRAADVNHPALAVHRRPRVAVLATGDELKPPGSDPGPGEIVYSNGFALMTLARSEGAHVIDLGVVGDRVGETIAAVRRAREQRAD